MKKLLSTLLVLSFIVSFTSCSDDDDDNPATTITLNLSETSVAVAGTVTLIATTNPKGEAVTWKSDDEKIATVVNGVITGVAKGETSIIASSGKSTAKCTLTVTTSDTKIVLDAGTKSIKVTDTFTLGVTVTPAGTTVTWKSSDDTIATVKDGLVTGLAKGSATITATAGSVSAKCDVTVTNDASNFIDLEAMCQGTLVATETQGTGWWEEMSCPDFKIEFVSNDGNGIFEFNMTGFFYPQAEVGKDDIAPWMQSGYNIEYFKCLITINTTDPENIFYSCEDSSVLSITGTDANGDDFNWTMSLQPVDEEGVGYNENGDVVLDGGGGGGGGAVAVDTELKTMSLNYSIGNSYDDWINTHTWTMNFQWK